MRRDEKASLLPAYVRCPEIDASSAGRDDRRDKRHHRNEVRPGAFLEEDYCPDLHHTSVCVLSSTG
jgi:hypothetical protein